MMSYSFNSGNFIWKLLEEFLAAGKLVFGSLRNADAWDLDEQERLATPGSQTHNCQPVMVIIFAC